MEYNQLVELRWKLRTLGIGHNLQYRHRGVKWDSVCNVLRISEWSEWIDIPVDDNRS